VEGLVCRGVKHIRDLTVAGDGFAASYWLAPDITRYSRDLHADSIHSVRYFLWMGEKVPSLKVGAPLVYKGINKSRNLLVVYTM